MDAVDGNDLEGVDDALSAWRQGDCVVGEQWFIHRFDPGQPLTEAAAEAASDDTDLVEVEVRGFMVATQTCDVVRECRHRPFVDVCPLVSVGSELLAEIERARRPNYAFVAGIADLHLVADLDRVMTVEKAVVATWELTPGCLDDQQVRHLSLALARKRARMAFPDDFNDVVAALVKRMRKKHNRDSDEGRALRSLREIRVRAAPEWDAPLVSLTFWFVLDDDHLDLDGQALACLRKLGDDLSADGRYASIEYGIVTLDDLTARDHVESDPLDLDDLSQ